MAIDREVGQGSGTFLPVTGSGPGGAACERLGEACWTKYAFSFHHQAGVPRRAVDLSGAVVRGPVLGLRYEGAHGSKIAIQPAEMPETGFDFGASITSPADGSTVGESETVTAGGSYAFPDLGEDSTGAGDHPTTRRVEVSVDDDSFTEPLTAVLDEESQTWRVKVGTLPVGEEMSSLDFTSVLACPNAGTFEGQGHSGATRESLPSERLRVPRLRV